jgi:zinc transport system ATP-binding protein
MQVDHSKNIVEMVDVSFMYENTSVLEHITLGIHDGDYLGVIGPNGGGKTTLLKIMLGLLKPTSGEIKINGHRIGYVPQRAVNFDLAFPATVMEVVEMGRYAKKGIFKNLNKTDAIAVKEALERVEMWEYRNKLIGELSGGQQQRVFIARALAGNPKIVFLDEPTVGVDIGASEKFYELMHRLNRDMGLTLVLVSHDIGVIANEVTEIACINHTLVYHGSPHNFMHQGNLEMLYGEGTKLAWHHHD